MSTLRDRLARYDAEVGVTLGAPPVVPAAMPTTIHTALVDLMDDMLTMGRAAARDAGGPAMTTLAVAMSAMHKLRGEALEALAGIPEDDVQAFMVSLAIRILRAVDPDGLALRVFLAGNRPSLPAAASTIGDDGAGADHAEAQRVGVPGGGDEGREVNALGVPAG